jgi:hypothetical protein
MMDGITIVQRVLDKPGRASGTKLQLAERDAFPS